jgi:phosphomannomutase
MDLAYQLDGEGKTLWDYLSMIENTVGAFASGQITLKLSPSEGTTSVGGQLRAQPPVRIGHHLVTRVDDFMDGFESFPPQDIIRYLIADGSRVIIRPSGTEPKVKIYLDTTGATGAEAHQRLEMLEQDMLALLGSLS